jgi:hypothetical protein
VRSNKNVARQVAKEDAKEKEAHRFLLCVLPLRSLRFCAQLQRPTRFGLLRSAGLGIAPSLIPSVAVGPWSVRPCALGESWGALRKRGKPVRHLSTAVHRATTRWGSRLAVGALLSLGLCGCASFWDEVTSKDFSINTYFNPPNPLTVLKESTDGDQRAKALAALHEPKANGGTDQDQDFVVQVLCTAASSERQPWCRLKAIGSLGQFKDPRAVKGLEDAYYKASVFPQDTAHPIRVASITAMGNTKNPDAVPILVRLLRQKPVEGSEQEKRQNMDERIAAAHSLSNFNQYPATEALVAVAQSEKDIALRDCAYDSLKTITGKDLPNDPQAWAEFLHQNGEKDIVVEAQGPFGKIMTWFGSGN